MNINMHMAQHIFSHEETFAEVFFALQNDCKNNTYCEYISTYETVDVSLQVAYPYMNVCTTYVSI